MESLAVIALLALRILGWASDGQEASGAGVVTEQTLLIGAPVLDPIGSGRIGDGDQPR